MAEEKRDFEVVGKNVRRVDGWEHVTGAAKFYGDIKLPGMLYGRILRSPHAHARIRSIDTSEAKNLRGVKAVITAEDTPKIPFCLIPTPKYEDKLPLEDKKVRYHGDEVAAVAAFNEEIAEAALDLIKVEYEPLPAVFDALEAMKPDAPLIHEDKKTNILHEMHWKWGDIEKGYSESEVIVEGEYRTSQPLAQPMETHGCLVHWESSGRINIWVPTQIPFYFKTQLSKTLNISPDRIHVNRVPIGGGFGSKDCLYPIEPIASILSRKTGRPVLLMLSREEEIMATRTRHPFIVKIKHGAKKDGTLTLRDVKVIIDKGAYADQGEAVLVDAAFVCGALYRVAAVKYDGYMVYTNKNYGGAFRGFGLPQSHYFIESQMDTLAEKLGIDPVELRLKNANEAGDVTVNNTGYVSCGLKECIEKSAAAIEWQERKKRKRPYRGVGIACGVDETGNRGFMGNTDAASATVSLSEEGILNVICAGVEMGQGFNTVMTQIAAEEMGVPVESIRLTTMDTDIVPFSIGVTYADRSTYIFGLAVLKAVADAKGQLIDIASDMLEARKEDIEVRDQKIFVRGSPGINKSIKEVISWGYFEAKKPFIVGRGFFDPDSTLVDPDTGIAQAPPGHCPTYPFQATAVELEVDPATYEVKILKMAQAVDCGRVLNPQMAKGQLDGGGAQGLGYALTEDLVYDAEGRISNASLTEYKIMSAADMPPITHIFADVIDPKGPFGAKGLGMAPYITVAPAVANAIYDAINVRIADLPITPEKIYAAMKK